MGRGNLEITYLLRNSIFKALGVRLSELISEDAVFMNEVVADETRQRELLQEDEEEDFLDEAIVNPEGKGCPVVLKLCSSMVLFEITAYMRETFKAVPKQNRSGRNIRTAAEINLSAQQGVGATVGARRWSYATQSIAGQSNASHQSLHMADHGIYLKKNPIVIYYASENRKISFVLQDQDAESIGSSKNSLSALQVRVTIIIKYIIIDC